VLALANRRAMGLQLQVRRPAGPRAPSKAKKVLFGLRLQLRHQQRRLRHGVVAYRGSVPYSFGGMATERKRGAHAFSGLNGADYEAAHCAGQRAVRPGDG
jgi:hypothetical protein